jgi:hypothetical protein
MVGSQNLTTPSTTRSPSVRHTPATSPRRLGPVLHDVRLWNMISPEHEAGLRALASLLLEGSGLTMVEAGDDHA